MKKINAEKYDAKFISTSFFLQFNYLHAFVVYDAS